ncbi:ECF-type sigma factor [Rugamonas aquatica]|uniref:Sigma-70 family RNA polymerase sigma factor n=1 Tax=Rugamonas aquatica TaxID=2743357 RepID=A0A6A7N7A9_9BURK|nr:ECF-type sigma factor [Rugamonas aquatica]MQA40778.1 sigma-70 family RNA polymerase sigma factor [Rugamonas aquatica]
MWQTVSSPCAALLRHGAAANSTIFSAVAFVRLEVCAMKSDPANKPEVTVEASPSPASAHPSPEHAESDWVSSPMVYQRLKKLARSFMSKERQGHTLQATDLAHSAYLRLFEQEHDFAGNRTQFVAMAATMMRRILVNYAISRNAEKRGAGIDNLTLGAAEFVPAPPDRVMVDVITLDRALTRLKEIDERMVTIIELRYFSDLTIEDTAEALGISAATVKREWTAGKLWLMKEMSKE